MKTKTKLGLVAGLLLSSILLVGCGDQIQTKKAQLTLENAEKLIQEEKDYILYTLNTEPLSGGHTQSTFYISNPRLVEDGKEDEYTTGYVNRFEFAYPYIVTTKGALMNNEPTTITDKTEEGKSKNYLRFSDEEEIIHMGDDEVNPNMVTLRKSDVKTYIMSSYELSKKQKEMKDVPEEDKSSIYAYTGADFMFRSIVDALTDLKLKEEIKVDGKELIVIEAQLKGDAEEQFLIYEDATVEFWIDKKSGKLIRETYTDNKNYSEETGYGQTIFTYVYDKNMSELTKAETIDEKLSIAKSWFFDDNKEQPITKKTKDTYLDLSGANAVKKEDTAEETESEAEENEK